MKPIFAILIVIGIVVPSVAFSSYMILLDDTADDDLSLDDVILPYTGGPTPSEIARSNNYFTLEIYKEIVNDPFNTENIFFSPFSIYMAFSLLYEGARENTAKQIEDVFGFNTDITTRHDQVVQTMDSINRDDEHAILETANALWLGTSAQESYVDIVRDVYQADIEPLTGVGPINEWASEKTHGKITEVLTELDGAVLVITNAIYFKGTWATQFDPEETSKRDFFRNPEDPVEVDFMQIKSTFNYAELDKVHILQMPYVGDRFSMFVFLPSEQTSIEQLEEMMSIEQIEKWKQSMTDSIVTVIIPKFTAKTEYFLNDYLSNLGMPDAFEDYVANFSGIGNDLFIGFAKQDAFVDVNEEGTEAAAVTTIAMADCEPREWKFCANKPFIFTIEDDESGTILFMGKIVDPSI